jgi:multiple sugar transport system permease protein
MRFNIWFLLKILAYIAIIMFFLFPIAWIFNMSFMTNDEILRKVPVLFYEPTLKNYIGLWKGEIAIEGFATMYVFLQTKLNK